MKLFKFLCILLALTVTLSFVACKGNTDNGDNGGDTGDVGDNGDNGNTGGDTGNTGGYMTWNAASSISKYYDIRSALD